MAPTLLLLAGPNGAGKTTAAPRLLRDRLGSLEFINADRIARGLSSFNPDRVAFQAGRILLARARQLARDRESFAVETTLSGRTYASWIPALKREGYRLDLLFLWLPSEELALSRVSHRVSLGGHDIPPAVVRRRYRAGLGNFFRLYRPLADSWRFYDNSGATPVLVAQEGVVYDATLWHNLECRWET
ncbi:MAG: AAA family ATPase [Candidatus Eremiobacterota bacterium]